MTVVKDVWRSTHPTSGINVPVVPEAYSDSLEAQNKRLKEAIRCALESAEEESIGTYRGTDTPREFVTVLKRALRQR